MRRDFNHPAFERSEKAALLTKEGNFDVAYFKPSWAIKNLKSFSNSGSLGRFALASNRLPSLAMSANEGIFLTSNRLVISEVPPMR